MKKVNPQVIENLKKLVDEYCNLLPDNPREEYYEDDQSRARAVLNEFIGYIRGDTGYEAVSKKLDRWARKQSVHLYPATPEEEPTTFVVSSHNAFDKSFAYLDLDTLQLRVSKKGKKDKVFALL